MVTTAISMILSDGYMQVSHRQVSSGSSIEVCMARQRQRHRSEEIEVRDKIDAACRSRSVPKPSASSIMGQPYEVAPTRNR